MGILPTRERGETARDPDDSLQGWHTGSPLQQVVCGSNRGSAGQRGLESWENRLGCVVLAESWGIVTRVPVLGPSLAPPIDVIVLWQTFPSNLHWYRRTAQPHSPSAWSPYQNSHLVARACGVDFLEGNLRAYSSIRDRVVCLWGRDQFYSLPTAGLGSPAW